MGESKKAALRITAVYALVGVAWILFSDQLVSTALPERLVQPIQSVKGFLFVIVTATVMYTLVVQLGERLSAEALRSSAAERMLRQVVATVPVGVILAASDGTISFLNRGAERLFGVEATEVLGSAVDTLMGEQVAGGSSITDLMRLGAIDDIRVGGRGGAPVRSVVARAAAIDPEQEATGWVIAVADVTAAHAARAEAERLVSAYRFMVDAIDASSRAEDEETILKRFAEVAVGSGRYRAAWSVHIDSESGEARTVAAPGLGLRAMETAETMVQWSRSDASKVPFEADGVMVSNDILRDPTNVWRPGALEDGFGSSVTVGVSADGLLVGGVTLFAAEVGAFDAAELDMLSDLLDGIGYQVTRIRRCAASNGEERVDSQDPL